MRLSILMPAEMAADHRRVEQALPGFMFALLFESLRNQGLEVRMDMEDLANKCSAAALATELGPKQVNLAKIVQRDGHAVLKNIGVDELPLMIGGLSRCLVKMQDQGRAVNQDALIIALSICAEIDDGVTDWGYPRRLNRTMSAIDNELVKLGYFKQALAV